MNTKHILLTLLASLVLATVGRAQDKQPTDAEKASILSHAERVGAESIVREELARPTPLTTIAAGVTEMARPELYRLAFTIVRGDETVSGSERIYLAQLANALGITPEQAAALEAQGARVIDAATES